MSNRSTKASSQKSAALICGGIVAAAILCGVLLGSLGSNDGFVEHYIDTSSRENQYLAAQMQTLGAFLGETCPGAKILLITDPINEYSRDRLIYMREAFEKGLANRATVSKVVSPSPPEPGRDDEPEEMLLYEYYLTAGIFDAMIANNPDCDMVISWMGLPYDFDRMSHWTKPEGERPQLVLLNANLLYLRKAIRAGYVSVAIAHRPDITYDPADKVPTDVAEAFDKRYLLITSENVDEVAARYPRMFSATQSP